MTFGRIVKLSAVMGVSFGFAMAAQAQKAPDIKVQQPPATGEQKGTVRIQTDTRDVVPSTAGEPVENPVVLKGFNPQPEPPAAATIPGTKTFNNVTLKRGTMASADGEPLIGEDGKAGTQTVMPGDNSTIQDVKIAPVAREALTMPRVLGQAPPVAKIDTPPATDQIVAPDM